MANTLRGAESWAISMRLLAGRILAGRILAAVTGATECCGSRARAYGEPQRVAT